jgi:hypothetical protein
LESPRLSGPPERKKVVFPKGSAIARTFAELRAIQQETSRKNLVFAIGFRIVQGSLRGKFLALCRLRKKLITGDQKTPGKNDLFPHRQHVLSVPGSLSIPDGPSDTGEKRPFSAPRVFWGLLDLAGGKARSQKPSTPSNQKRLFSALLWAALEAEGRLERKEVEAGGKRSF